MAFNSSGRRDLNSPALADIHPVVERLSRLRGCVSTQVIQPGGDSAKVGGGVWGPMGGAGLRGPTRDPHKATLFVDSGLFDPKELSAHCPESSTFTPIPIGATAIGLPRSVSGVLRFLLGIGGGLRDYDRRLRNIANPLKPMARSERAEGSGTEATRNPKYSECTTGSRDALMSDSRPV